MTRTRGPGCDRVPDFTVKFCCDEHDRHYGVHDVSRAEADAELRRCIWARRTLVDGAVRRALAVPFYGMLAGTYWIGVRLFGGSHWTAQRSPMRAWT